MAGESLHGSNGSITVATDYANFVGGTDLHIREWHATFTSDLHPDNSFDQNGSWEYVVRGCYDVKGTFVASWAVGKQPALPFGSADAFTGTGPTVQDFTLQTEAGHTYTFKGIMSSVRTVPTKTGLVMVTGSFESSGEVTVA